MPELVTITLDTFFQFSPRHTPLAPDQPYDLPSRFVEAYGKQLRGIDVQLERTVGGSFRERELAELRNFTRINDKVQELFGANVAHDPAGLLQPELEFTIPLIGSLTRAFRLWDYRATGGGYQLYQRARINDRSWDFDPQLAKYVEPGGESASRGDERVLFEIMFVVQTPNDYVE